MTQVMESIEQMQERLAAMRQKRADVHAAQAENERRRAQLLAEAEQLQVERRAKALLPGEPAVAVADPRLDEVEAEMERLSTEEQQIEEEVADLERSVRERVEHEIPGSVTDTANAIGELVAALEDLGRAVPPLARQAVEAREEFREEHRVLDRLLTVPVVPAEDVSVRNRQEAEIRSYLKAEESSASAEAKLGFLLLDLIDWLRRGSSPVQAFLAEQGLEPLEGSVLQMPPIPGSDDVLMRLESDRLPIL